LIQVPLFSLDKTFREPPVLLVILPTTTAYDCVLRCIKDLTSLQTLLTLNNNGIGDMGAAKLVEETKHLNSLKELYLWSNKIIAKLKKAQS